MVWNIYLTQNLAQELTNMPPLSDQNILCYRLHPATSFIFLLSNNHCFCGCVDIYIFENWIGINLLFVCLGSDHARAM